MEGMGRILRKSEQPTGKKQYAAKLGIGGRN